MNRREGVLVRIYLTQSRAKIEPLLRRLERSGHARGLTIFEGAAGLGTTPRAEGELVSIEGKPIVIEFFDTEAAAQALIVEIERLVAPRHIVMFPVTVCSPSR